MRIPALLVLAFLSAAALPPPAGAGSLTLYTEEYPPFNMTEKDTVIGIATDILRELLTRTNTDYRIVLGPWQRSYAAAQEQPDSCVFSTTVTEARRPLFKWVEPLVQNDWTFFSRADKPIKLGAVEDVRKYRIGVYQGDAFETYLRELGGFQLDSANRDVLNATKLGAGRIDLWATGGQSGPWYAAQEHAVTLSPSLVIRQAALGLACHPQTDDAVIGRLRAALADAMADGTTARITARYSGSRP